MESASEVQRDRMELDRSPGLYRLRTNTPTQQGVVKVVLAAGLSDKQVFLRYYG